MNKQQALKQINDATNAMAHLTIGTELYAIHKQMHTEAKAALNAIWEAEQSVNEEVKTDAEVIETAQAEIKTLKAMVRAVTRCNGSTHNATQAARKKLEVLNTAFNQFVLMMNMNNNGYDCEDIKQANKIKLLKIIN